MRKCSKSWSACCARPRSGIMSSARWISASSASGWMRGRAFVVTRFLDANRDPLRLKTLLALQKPARGDLRQPGDRPVVDIGPRLAGRAVLMRHGEHAADILGRFRKTFATGFIHVEFAEQRVAVAQAI